ncbi:MAG: site-specific DNA-methyltransferase [Candidatus Thermofonsia Clade 1 bacterium]|uniref:Methyltransferase n=1 Tax=Candidatus Thermofonsia Clade 1 bacterium TaxID=2364210 RepID=A0A2M8PF39_9CHLR|nr:MAG: site-specific DNA-methyltransferase [Candidatus Thermofonsia Clade 1 bacterium]RMF49201.1 MAG: site-specific DNA-methyltransferase [Chloroflexota bacterium]
MTAHVDSKQLAAALQISEAAAQQLINGDLTALTGQSSAIPVAQGNIFLQKHNVTLYHADFLTSQALADESVDLIVTSPPYNVGIEYSTHDDAHTYEAYLTFSERWLRQAYRLSRPDGRLCMNIPLDKNKGGQQSVCADVTSIAKKVGWKYHATIIWNEGNISRRTAWGSWMSASAPFVIAPVEVIVVMYKERWKKARRPKAVSDITRQEFMEWTNGVWAFSGESKRRVGHPAPFPRELPRRCIKLFSFVGETVLDPFVGSGTTLLEAYENNRVGIGFEIALEYCQLARKRLEALWRQRKLI